MYQQALIPTVFTQMQDEVFSLNFLLKVSEVVLNLHMKHQTGLCQTGSLWTGPCRAKRSCALPNHHARYALFWDIMQLRRVIPYLHSEKPKHPIFKGQEIQTREQCMTEVNWHNLFLDLCLSSNFLKKHDVSEAGTVSVFKLTST